jgi:hypothetical protein
LSHPQDNLMGVIDGHAILSGAVIRVAVLLLAGSQVWASPGASGQPAGRKLTFSELAAGSLVTARPPEEEASRVLGETVALSLDRTVEITGYMLPVRIEQGRAKEFLLMRSQAMCCYGQLPAPNEYIAVTVGGEGVRVTMDVPVKIRGTLRLEPIVEGGQFLQFYRMESGMRIDGGS